MQWRCNAWPEGAHPVDPDGYGGKRIWLCFVNITSNGKQYHSAVVDHTLCSLPICFHCLLRLDADAFVFACRGVAHAEGLRLFPDRSLDVCQDACSAPATVTKVRY